MGVLLATEVCRPEVRRYSGRALPPDRTNTRATRASGSSNAPPHTGSDGLEGASGLPGGSAVGGAAGVELATAAAEVALGGTSATSVIGAGVAGFGEGVAVSQG